MSQDLIIGSTSLDWSRSSDAKDMAMGHHRHHHHHRGQWQPGQVPGQYPGQIPGQYPGQYQGQPTGTVQPDPQKLQLLRSTYQQIKNGHINWLTNQDHQNNVWNTPANTYLQSSRLWARQQLQQQQLPIKSDPSTYGQWQQPLSWFQAQTQAALNSAASQMASSVTTTQQPASAPYTPPSAYPNPTSYAAPQPAPTAPANVYYPAPGDGSYDDDDQSGWPGTQLMHGAFVGDEARAERENRATSCGDSLPHNEYRALVIRQAIKNAGGQNPSTKHFYAAKKAVDNALGNAGVAIYIPGAKPCRRTV